MPHHEWVSGGGGYDRPGEPRPVDIVQIGGAASGAPPNRRRLWWVPLALVVLLAVAFAARREAVHRAAPLPAPAPTTSAFGYPTPAPLASSTVTEVGHPLLDTAAGWELFARGDNSVVRIQPALGRVSRTPVPLLNSSGPVSFIVGRDRVLIRPLDYVRGYLVPDGQPARALPGLLGRGGGLIFPGPDPDTVWILAGGTGAEVMQLRLDGGWTGTTLPTPADDDTGSVYPDGAGYLLFFGSSSVFHVTSGPVRTVTTGRMLAVGPTRWLAAECDARHICSRVVMDHQGGARRLVGGPVPVDARMPAPGAISPDGALAAVPGTDQSGQLGVHLLDLVSGVERPLAVPIGPWQGVDGAVWSPDGRWLFLVGDRGQLVVVEPGTGRARDLGVQLPMVSQLAVRPG